MSTQRIHDFPAPGSTLFLESGQLCRLRKVRQWDRPGSKWVIFQGGFFSPPVEPTTEQWLKVWRPVKGATVSVVDYREHFDAMVAAGNEALEFLDKRGIALSQTATGTFLEKRLGSPRVFDALKKQLAIAIRDRIFFFRLAQMFSREMKDLVIVRDGPDILGLDEQYGAGLRVVHVGRWYWKLWGLSLLMIFAHWGRFLYRRGLTPAKPAPAAVDFAAPIVRGFERQLERVTEWMPDDYLWDSERFRPERFLYVLDLWLREPARGASLPYAIKYLQEHGAVFTDVRSLPLSPTTVGRFARDTIQFLGAVVQDLCAGRISPLIADAARRVLFAMFQEEGFLEHWAPKVYLARDDHSLTHIIRTIVFNRRGLKTIGVPHSTYLPQGLLPNFAYIYYDAFCVYGLGYVEKNWPKWLSSNRAIAFGFDQNDETCRLVRNGVAEKTIRERYPYAVILGWLPPATNPSGGVCHSRILDTVEGVNEICRRHPEVGIVVKPRHSDIPFYKKLISDGVLCARAHLLDREISTPHLLAASDVIVSSTISSTFVQAVCAGKKKVVTVDYFDWNAHPFRAYSPSLVVADSSQLTKRVEEMLVDEGIDHEGLVNLQNDFDPFSDGHAVLRFKAEALRLLESVEHGHGAIPPAAEDER